MRLGVVVAFAAAFTISVPAWAEGELYRPAPPPETAQNFQIEFRFAPYKPQIDSAPGVTGSPYERSFGTDVRILPALELDWQVLHIPHFGSVGPALSVGYTSASGVATFSADGSASAESTTLEVIPFYGVAVLRVDVFEKDFGIPLIPYGKAGVGMALWRASNDNGTSVAKNGIEGKGMTWGTHFALGIGLSLNWLDRRAARNLDGAVGINDTLVFFEWMFMNLDGFGQTDKLRVGTSTWVAGLSFAF